MTAIGRAPLPTVPRIHWWSRVYGLGTVYAKTFRESRLAVLIVSGMVTAMLLSSGVAFGEAYATVGSRAELAQLVGDLPPVMRGVYGNPFPTAIETLGGSTGWKTGWSLGLLAAIWSVIAMAGTLAAEARRGSLEFVATTPLGLRRIAAEKVAAHVTGMAIVVAITVLCAWSIGVAFATVPGDDVPFGDALGYGLWLGLVALASGGLAFVLAQLFGRAAGAGIAGAVAVIGYFVNGYQAAVPEFAGLANLTWWGWTAGHQPLSGTNDWAALALVALLVVVLFAGGIELFARRDLGVFAHVPWPGVPGALLGLRGPAGRSFGERMPVAIAWAVGIGLFGFVFGAASRSMADTFAESGGDIRRVFETVFPNLELEGAGAFLQLAFITFGLILAGFAAATLVSGWASDEENGRLETLLATPVSRIAWALRSGLGLSVAIGVMTLVIMVAIGLGAAIAGGDVLTPVAGAAVVGLYALALAGVGLAVGGLFGTSLAAEFVAGIVIVTFLIDILAPALHWPGWVYQLALTAHLGKPMIGVWDWPGMALCVAIAVGGLLVSAWGMQHRDVAR